MSVVGLLGPEEGRGQGAGSEAEPLSTAAPGWVPASQGSTAFLSRDVRALGITLMGHQKKILGSIQTMRAQLTSTQGPRRHL